MATLPAANEHLIAQHLPWARNLARRAARKLPPSVDLEDLEQIASVALMRCAAEYSDQPAQGYRRPTPFTVFAWRPVYYACLMAYRGRHYRDVTHAELPARTEATVNTEQGAARSQTLEALSAVVLSLPDVQAAVLSLHYFEGYSIAEAARELRVSEGWCSQKHKEGLRNLRNALAQLGLQKVADCL